MINIYMALGGVVALLFVTDKKRTQTLSENPQLTRNPASAAAPRADRGAGANQPWYQGPKVGAGGAGSSGSQNLWANPNTYIQGATALAGLASTVSDFFSSQPDSVSIEGTEGPADVTEFSDADNFSLDTNSDTDDYPGVDTWYDEVV